MTDKIQDKLVLNFLSRSLSKPEFTYSSLTGTNIQASHEAYNKRNSLNLTCSIFMYTFCSNSQSEETSSMPGNGGLDKGLDCSDYVEYSSGRRS